METFQAVSPRWWETSPSEDEALGPMGMDLGMG